MAKFKVGDRIFNTVYNEGTLKVIAIGKTHFFLEYESTGGNMTTSITNCVNKYELRIDLPKIGTTVRPYAGDEFYREKYYTIEYYFKRLSIDWFILSPKSWAEPFIISYDGLKANFSI